MVAKWVSIQQCRVPIIAKTHQVKRICAANKFGRSSEAAPEWSLPLVSTPIASACLLSWA